MNEFAGIFREERRFHVEGSFTESKVIVPDLFCTRGVYVASRYNFSL
jgi:hypothetical protein